MLVDKIWKESLYSVCQQFHRNQQKKRKFIQCLSTIPPKSTKQTITSNLKPLNRQQKKTYDFRNPGTDLGRA
jgi:hypothetical protein